MNEIVECVMKVITSQNGRSVKSAMVAVEEDYCIPMAIFDSRTLTRTTWRESLKSDAGPNSMRMLFVVWRLIRLLEQLSDRRSRELAL